MKELDIILRLLELDRINRERSNYIIEKSTDGLPPYSSEESKDGVMYMPEIEVDFIGTSLEQAKEWLIENKAELIDIGYGCQPVIKTKA